MTLKETFILNLQNEAAIFAMNDLNSKCIGEAMSILHHSATMRLQIKLKSHLPAEIAYGNCKLSIW